MPARLVDRAITVSIAAFLVLSGAAMAGALSAEPWVRFALRLETASTPLDMAERLRTRLAAQIVGPHRNACDYDLAKSRVTVAMDLLSRSVGTASPSVQQEQAAATARGVVQDAIRCAPADGNLWYILALLEQRASADWERVARLLSMSVFLSPGEGDLLLKRARLMSIALAEPGNVLSGPLKADLRKAIATLRAAPAASVLATLRDKGRVPLADELVADLPETRKAALAAGTDRPRSTFGRPERFRHYDFRPFEESRPPEQP